MNVGRSPPSRVARRLCSASVALALALVTAAARADENASNSVDAARALADDGANAFAGGDYTRAHERLRRAFALFPAPTIAVLDARALSKLGRLAEAAAAYRNALASPLDSTSPAAFRDAVVSAEAELAAVERRLARLTLRVHDTPRGANVQVWLDGAEIAPHELGRPLAVDPKAHSIRLDIDGQHETVHRVTLREGEALKLDLAPASGDGASRALAIVSFGLSGAGLATGVVAGGLALGSRKEAVRGCPERRCERGSEGATALGDFRRYRVISGVGYGVGAAGAVLGTILLVSGSTKGGAKVGVAPTLEGVELRGRF